MRTHSNTHTTYGYEKHATEYKQDRYGAGCVSFDKFKAQQTDFYYRFNESICSKRNETSITKIICRKRKTSSNISNAQVASLAFETLRAFWIMRVSFMWFYFYFIFFSPVSAHFFRFFLFRPRSLLFLTHMKQAILCSHCWCLAIQFNILYLCVYVLPLPLHFSYLLLLVWQVLLLHSFFNSFKTFWTKLFYVIY